MTPDRTPRDVMADAFDTLPDDELRGCDVADRLMWALYDAGWMVVADEEAE